MRVETGDATLARFELLTALKLEEVEDVIPADGTLLVLLRPGAQPSATLLAHLAGPTAIAASRAARTHEIPVIYGGRFGPDLAGLAARAELDVPAFINAHAATEFTVAFLGFQPGFPYLDGLPAVLQAPRRTSPRVRVEAGSVAIGGRYAGIYPATGPGGWQIIGRTSWVWFDPQRNPPSLLLPGDRIRFVPQ